jgi:hypothetical protein
LPPSHAAVSAITHSAVSCSYPYVCLLPSQKHSQDLPTIRLNINYDLLNAGAVNVFYFIDARSRIGGDVNFAWRRPCRRAGSQRSHAGRWSENVAWSSCSCGSHVPVSAERRAELTSHLNPPRRALGCVHQPGGLRDLYVGPGVTIRRPGVRAQYTRKVAH